MKRGCFLAHVLTVLVVLASGLATAQSAAPVANVRYDDAAALLDRIDTIMSALEGVRSAVDLTAFDAGELAFELAFEDAETISAWVRERIAFEPYAGVLRGPDGTLRAQAGNSFDQALLLALLLADAGFETRIAIATLDVDATDRLLSHATSASRAPPAIGDRDAIRAALIQLSEAIGDDQQQLLEALDQALAPTPLSGGDALAELAEIERGIMNALGGSGAELGSDAMETLRSESAHYAWTEYRLGAEDPWTAAHPTGFEPEAGLAPEESFDGSIPEEYLHRVRIEAWIEAKTGDELSIEPIMNPWERPVANADHVVVDYANLPDQSSAPTPGNFDLAELADGAQAFVPYLFGNIAPGALIYDLDGRVLSPDVANSMAAGVFRSLAQNAEGALGALGSIGSDEPAGDALALTGHGLDVTIIAPDGSETTYRRWIVDRIGPEARAAGRTEVADDAPDLQATARALLGRHRLMVSTGATTPGYLLVRTIDRILETRGIFELIAANLASPLGDLDVDADLVPGAPGLDHLGALDAFDRSLASTDAGPGFRPSPAVLILSETIAPSGDAFRRSVDIVANPRRILAGGGDAGEELRLDPHAALRRGVWETLVERELLLGEGGDGQDAQSPEVAGSLAAADLRGPYRLLQPGEEVDADALGLDGTAAARIEDDLARGQMVLLGALPGGDEPAWWRIDPLSGATLGVTADGRGQSMTEYTIQLYDNAFTVMFAVKGISDCVDVEAGPARACCLLKAHLSNVAGLGLGSVVGGALGSGAGLIFGVVTGVAGVDWSDSMGLDCADFGAGY